MMDVTRFGNIWSVGKVHKRGVTVERRNVQQPIPRRLLDELARPTVLKSDSLSTS